MIYRILILLILASGGIVIISCKSTTKIEKGDNSNSESLKTASNNGVIIGKIKEILEQKNIKDTLSLCAINPCTAEVFIQNIVQKTPELLDKISDSGLIVLNFQMTLSPTHGMPHFKLDKNYPGLKKGDKFKGIIECYPLLSNSNSNCIVKDYIKL